MKKTILLLTFYMVQTMLTAQANAFQTGSGSAIDRMRESDLIAKNNNIDLSTSSIKGSRYLNEEYSEGSIVKGKVVFTKEMLYKFDAYKNAVQVKILENKQELALFNNSIDTFMIVVDNRVNVFVKAIVVGESEIHKLYQAVYLDSSYSMIKLLQKKIVKVTSTDVFSANDNYDEFQNQDIYFIKKGNNPYQKVKISKKGLFEALPEKKNALTRLFDSSKMKGELTDAKLAILMQSIQK
jgi:hypothetical protein